MNSKEHPWRADSIAESIAGDLEDLLEIGDAPDVAAKPLPPLPPGVSPRDVLLFPGNKIFQGVDSPLTPIWMNASPGTPSWLKGAFPRTPTPQGVRELLRSPAWTLSPLRNSVRRAAQAEGQFAEVIISHSAQREKPMMPPHWQSLDMQRAAEPEAGGGGGALTNNRPFSVQSADLAGLLPTVVPISQGGPERTLPPRAAKAQPAAVLAQPAKPEVEVRPPQGGVHIVEQPHPRSGGAALLLERDSALLKGWAAQSAGTTSSGRRLDRADSGMTVSSNRLSGDRSGAKTPISQPRKHHTTEEVRRSAEGGGAEDPRGSILKRRAFKPLTSLVTKSPRAENNKAGPHRKRGFAAQDAGEEAAGEGGENLEEDEQMPDVQLAGLVPANSPFGPPALLPPWDATSPTTLLDGTSILSVISELNQARQARDAIAATALSPPFALVVPTTPAASMSVFGAIGGSKSVVANPGLVSANPVLLSANPPPHIGKTGVVASAAKPGAGNAPPLPEGLSSNRLDQVYLGGTANPSPLNPLGAQLATTPASSTGAPTADDLADLEAFLQDSIGGEVPSPSSPLLPGFGGGVTVPLGSLLTDLGVAGKSAETLGDSSWESIFGNAQAWQSVAEPSADAGGSSKGGAAPPENENPARTGDRKGEATVSTQGGAQRLERELSFRQKGEPPPVSPEGAAVNLAWLGEWQHQDAAVSPTHSDYVSFTICGNSFEIPAKFKPGKLVGRSQQGDVCAAILADCGEEFAIRKISDAFRDGAEARRTLREIRLLQHLKHDNIVAMKGVLPPPSLRNFRDVYIAFELMDSDLFHLLASEEPLSESHCQFFLYQLLRGLKYLHSANVLHRDLKPSSILVNAACDLKVCDFGAARPIFGAQWGDEGASEVVATRWYRPPELLLACSQTTPAVDVWSAGCVLAELLLKRPLFPGVDALHQLNLILEVLGSPSDAELAFVTSANARAFMRSLPRRQKVSWASIVPEGSEKALDLLDRMLTFDPGRRITVDAALAHPYLEHLHDPKDVPVAPQAFLYSDKLPSPAGPGKQALSIAEIQTTLYNESVSSWR
ncbi:mitogen-activated protein kinase [Klebsormidium nitens]|uniref:Mitogen-activated protein kinase n=1 Tax=Klebsormidium nitens TaxID=105231 RepID=A0A1Y1IMT8_KLENI|nr:mitogen-activated protein kinase [Klebsormidium nitens]|eukprot:GAQ92215.1 mitogen-activated protein kinase [Klebsormidium nitens]